MSRISLLLTAVLLEMSRVELDRTSGQQGTDQLAVNLLDRSRGILLVAVDGRLGETRDAHLEVLLGGFGPGVHLRNTRQILGNVVYRSSAN